MRFIAKTVLSLFFIFIPVVTLADIIKDEGIYKRIVLCSTVFKVWKKDHVYKSEIDQMSKIQDVARDEIGRRYPEEDVIRLIVSAILESRGLTQDDFNDDALATCREFSSLQKRRGPPYLSRE